MGKLLAVAVGVGVTMLTVGSVRAADQFVTVVNPVRVTSYSPSPLVSLKTQYQVVAKNNLPATWLLTYDVLSNPELVRQVKQMNTSQEIGVFLEVSDKLAEASQVGPNSGSWHHANVVFLSGYPQQERKQLIDTLFSKFESVFGYLPKSVGSWWSDSFSLSYMQEKYGIVANLGVADQYSTDGYQVWGQYWSMPFVPRKGHAGLPASGQADSLKLVTIQWAPRHPKFGYQSSLYSTQDYKVIPESKLDINFFESLLALYGKGDNGFGQVTVGLESDLAPDAYTGEYSAQLEAVVRSGLQPVTMQEFAKWYLRKFGFVTPEMQVEADGVRWYQSPHYRIGVDVVNQHIIDLRVYPNLQEPYYLWPNKEHRLFIYVPAVVDTLQNPDRVWSFVGGEIKTYPDHFEVLGSMTTIPHFVQDSVYFNVNEVSSGYQIWPKRDFVSDEGWVFSDWTSEAIHAFKSPRVWLRWLVGRDWQMLSKQQYFVSQSEIDALNFLKSLPGGKVMVVSQECLQCQWYGKFKPAVFANRRNYVGDLSNKRVKYDSEVLSAPSQIDAKRNFTETGAEYVYLVKYGAYLEQLPYSPGDLGVEKIYENANAQIWEKTHGD